MFGLRIFKEQSKIYLIGIGLFFLFGFSAGCLPQLLPASLSFIASIIAFLSWLGIGFVMVAFWGFGPLAKRLNKVAIEEDEKERSKYKVKRKRPTGPP
jgi:hypothetical protein